MVDVLVLCAMGDDWEEGLPWLLLAAREAMQESTGFSPNELVFGYTVRVTVRQLAPMQDDWRKAEPLQNLTEYVSGFRQKLCFATELARKKLAAAQHKIKRLTTVRLSGMCSVQVLALLPLVRSPFQLSSWDLILWLSSCKTKTI